MNTFNLGKFLVKLNTGRDLRFIWIELENNKLNEGLIIFLFELGLLLKFVYHGKKIRVYYKYRLGLCSFKKLTLISKPRRKIYLNLVNLEKEVVNASGDIIIMSTSQGYMTGGECLWKKIGGEAIFKIVF